MRQLFQSIFLLLAALQYRGLVTCQESLHERRDNGAGSQVTANPHFQHTTSQRTLLQSTTTIKSPSATTRPGPSPRKSPPVKSPPRKTAKSPKPAKSPKKRKSPKKSPSPKPRNSPRRSPSPKGTGASPQRQNRRASLKISPPAQWQRPSSPKRSSPSPKLPDITTPGRVISGNQTAQACWRKTPFFQGMNIAYNNYTELLVDEPGKGYLYGSNFGDSSLYPRRNNFNSSWWADTFEELQQVKGTVARLWLFKDGRQLDLWKNGRDGKFTGWGAQMYKDLDNLFNLAAARNIKLMPTLFSWVIMEDKSASPFPWPAEAPFDRSFMVKNWTVAESFMTKMLQPLVIRYNKHPAMYAWDCMNEPEQITSNPDPRTKGATFAKASMADWQHWVAMCTAVVHQYSDTPVTLGSWEVFSLCTNTSMGCQGNRWSDNALRTNGLPHRQDLWKFAYLDFYQAHFYKKNVYPLPDEQYPLGKPACMWGIDKPLMIGESPNRSNWGPNYSPARLLEFACKNGYMGVMFWSMRTGQDDPTRNWQGYIPALTNFDVTTCTSRVVG